jgi:hypothetical protein
MIERLDFRWTYCTTKKLATLDLHPLARNYLLPGRQAVNNKIKRSAVRILPEQLDGRPDDELTV